MGEESVILMTADEALAAVRASGVTGELVAYDLDDEAALGYTGWWSVVEDSGDLLLIGAPIRVVSPTGRVFEFGSIPPWVSGLSAERVVAGDR
jgi:hypothetical protein